jgi:hypothetical protein
VPRIFARNRVLAVNNSGVLAMDMDKDRIVGAAHRAKGAVKETAGKATRGAKDTVRKTTRK